MPRPPQRYTKPLAGRRSEPLLEMAGLTWVKEGRGLSKQEQAALRKLSGSHGSSGRQAKQQARGMVA
jgi:hypothetical protein